MKDEPDELPERQTVGNAKRNSGLCAPVAPSGCDLEGGGGDEIRRHGDEAGDLVRRSELSDLSASRQPVKTPCYGQQNTVE